MARRARSRRRPPPVVERQVRDVAFVVRHDLGRRSAEHEHRLIGPEIVRDELQRRRMLDEARSLIVKEIAIARGQTEDDVKNEIEAIFLSN